MGLNLASIRYNNTKHLEIKMQNVLIFIESKKQILAVITMCLLIHSYLVFDILCPFHHLASVSKMGIIT